MAPARWPGPRRPGGKGLSAISQVGLLRFILILLPNTYNNMARAGW